MPKNNRGAVRVNLIELHAFHSKNRTPILIDPMSIAAVGSYQLTGCWIRLKDGYEILASESYTFVKKMIAFEEAENETD